MDPETICIGGEVAVRLRGPLEGVEGFGSPPGGGDSLLELVATRDPFPRPERMEPVFESTGLWRVLSSGGTHVFELPHLTAVVDFEAGSGRIHLRDAAACAHVFDYPLDEVVFSRLLAGRGAAIVHACGVEHRGRGILLAGVSGAGKSTLATLLEGRDGARVLGDDRVAVFARGGRARISGTPWPGTSGHALDRTVPLERILFLGHGRSNRVEPVGRLAAAARLASLSVIPYWHEGSARGALDAVADAASCVPAARLSFVPDPAAAELVLRLAGRSGRVTV